MLVCGGSGGFDTALPEKEDDKDDSGMYTGKQVRVISEHAGRAAYGQSGRCISHKAGSVHMQTDDLTSFHIFDEYIQEDLESKVPSISKKPLTKMGNLLKETIIGFIGQGVESITMKTRLQDGHICMMWKWYQWQYELDERMMHISPALSRMMCEIEDGKTHDEEGLHYLQDEVINAKMMLIPVWASSEHWTLMVIHIEEKLVRYYDSLDPTSTLCMKNATKIIKQLKKNMSSLEWLPHEGLSKRNAAHQNNGVDCGVYVIHWMEEEIRYFRGEGMGHEWPQIITMRSRIMGFASLLKKHEDKMKQKAAEDEAKAAAEKKVKEDEHTDGKKKEDTVTHDEKAKGKAPKLTWGCPKCKHADSGCLKCNPEKAEAYKKKKEEEEKKKK